jgi:hypothetical protein
LSDDAASTPRRRPLLKPRRRGDGREKPNDVRTVGTICFHCRRDVYGLQAIGAVRVCGRSDCLLAALDTLARRANAA